MYDSIWPNLKAPLPPISDEEFAEFEYFLKLENEWIESQPNYSFRELMGIFPEATMAARRGLKARLKLQKEKLRSINSLQEEYYDNVISKAHFQEQAEMKEESDRDFNDCRSRHTSKIKQIMFNLSYLDEMEGKSAPRKMGGVNEEEIAQAKEISIINFYPGKLRKHGDKAMGLCPFHNENSPSFVIYLSQNTFWCYGCNSGGTVIDFIMRSNNLSFLEAVKFLIKK